MARSAVFIDNGYLSKVLTLVFNRPKICYEKFSDAVCKEHERLRTYFYDCPPYQSNPPTDEQKMRASNFDSFIYNLRKLSHFEVRLGKLIYIPSSDDYVQKRVDVLLSVDLVRMSWDHQIERAVLVTGDSDFVPAIQAVKDAGVETVLYYGRGNQLGALDELLYACDERLEITKELVDSCLLPATKNWMERTHIHR